MDSLYDDTFYDKQVSQSAGSAQRILPYLWEVHQPTSVLELGCGRGGWLAELERLGAKTLLGYDGPWVDPKDLLSQNIQFSPIDFERDEIKVDQKLDMAMSLEVAEHVSAAAADRFVDMLCRASDFILFGAAIKYQGGVSHVNEQRQSYWASKFAERGYLCFDIVRRPFWNNEHVSWVYSQNAFVFVRDTPELADVIVECRKRDTGPLLDIVHPENFESRIDRFENPSWRTCVRCIGNYIRKKKRKLVG